MITQDLLKQYILEIIEEMRNANVPNQLQNPRGKGKSKKKDADKKNKDSEKEVEEMNVVANIAGYTAPLGASSADVGANPTRPGKKLKKNKKNFIRWK